MESPKYHWLSRTLRTACVNVIVGLTVASAAHAQTAAPAAAMPAGPRTLTVSFLHLNVANLEQSLTVFRDLLGMEVVTPPAAPREARQLVDEPGALLQTVVLQVPGGGWKLELVQWHGIKVNPQQPRIQDPGEIMLAVSVRDIDALVAGAKKLGLTVLTEGGAPITRTGADGTKNRAVMIREHNGFIIEFVEGGATPVVAPAKLGNVSIYLTVKDLEQTVNFYNRVFGFTMDAPGKAQPPPDSMIKLFNDKSLKTVRMARGTFPGAGSEIRFQEFTGPNPHPVRHRVQDPGGPIMPMTVQDFPAVIAAAKANGGTIGTGETSATLPADARSSWIRDPNGMLFNASMPRPPVPPTPPSTPRVQ
jgi:catechol 2,3-dioxygenase-like lactoylglutathione lyase family enzyme